MTRFHGIYWPAFLAAANLDPPNSILCHCHWTVDGEKMSKSKNNVVSPFHKMNDYTADGLRYFLLREGVNHSDGNYSEVKAVRMLNAELADTLGNLLNRCTGVALNPLQVFPQMDEESLSDLAKLDNTRSLMESVLALPDIVREHYDAYNFHKVVDSIMATLHCANLFFETTKPWEMKKRPEHAKKLDAILHVTMESLRVCGVTVHPIIPNLARTLLDKLDVAPDRRNWPSLSQLSWDDPAWVATKLRPEKVLLYRRIISGEKDATTARGT